MRDQVSLASSTFGEWTAATFRELEAHLEHADDQVRANVIQSLCIAIAGDDELGNAPPRAVVAEVRRLARKIETSIASLDLDEDERRELGDRFRGLLRASP